MKTLSGVIIIAVIVLVLVGAAFFLTRPSDSGKNEIKIESFAFNPLTLTIKLGDTVTWENYDSVAHTVTSDSGSELNSTYLAKAQEYSHTFNTRGTFDYHCIPHPNMKGKIIVE